MIFAVLTCLNFYVHNKLEFEQKYISTKKNERYKNIHRQIKPNHFIYLQSYNIKKQKGFRFTYEIFDENKLISKFKSDFITWDTLQNKWLAENYNFRELLIRGEKIKKGSTTLIDLDFKPHELIYQNSTN